MAGHTSKQNQTTVVGQQRKQNARNSNGYDCQRAKLAKGWTDTEEQVEEQSGDAGNTSCQWLEVSEPALSWLLV